MKNLLFLCAMLLGSIAHGNGLATIGTLEPTQQSVVAYPGDTITTVQRTPTKDGGTQLAAVLYVVPDELDSAKLRIADSDLDDNRLLFERRPGVNSNFVFYGVAKPGRNTDHNCNVDSVTTPAGAVAASVLTLTVAQAEPLTLAAYAGAGGSVLLELVPYVSVATAFTYTVYVIWQGASEWADDAPDAFRGIRSMADRVAARMQRYASTWLYSLSGACYLLTQEEVERAYDELEDGLEGLDELYQMEEALNQTERALLARVQQHRPSGGSNKDPEHRRKLRGFVRVLLAAAGTLAADELLTDGQLWAGTLEYLRTFLKNAEQQQMHEVQERAHVFQTQSVWQNQFWLRFFQEKRFAELKHLDALFYTQAQLARQRPTCTAVRSAYYGQVTDRLAKKIRIKLQSEPYDRTIGLDTLWLYGATSGELVIVHPDYLRNRLYPTAIPITRWDLAELLLDPNNLQRLRWQPAVGDIIPWVSQSYRPLESYGAVELLGGVDQILQGLGSESAHVMDVGAGPGVALEDLRQRAGRVGITLKGTGVSVDVEPSLVEGLEWFLGPAELLPARYKSTQDLILCSTTSRYFQVPSEALLNLLTALKPGGMLALYDRLGVGVSADITDADLGAYHKSLARLLTRYIQLGLIEVRYDYDSPPLESIVAGDLSGPVRLVIKRLSDQLPLPLAGSVLWQKLTEKWEPVKLTESRRFVRQFSVFPARGLFPIADVWRGPDAEKIRPGLSLSDEHFFWAVRTGQEQIVKDVYEVMRQAALDPGILFDAEDLLRVFPRGPVERLRPSSRAGEYNVSFRDSVIGATWGGLRDALIAEVRQQSGDFTEAQLRQVLGKWGRGLTKATPKAYTQLQIAWWEKPRPAGIAGLTEAEFDRLRRLVKRALAQLALEVEALTPYEHWFMNQ